MWTAQEPSYLRNLTDPPATEFAAQTNVRFKDPVQDLSESMGVFLLLSMSVGLGPN